MPASRFGVVSLIIVASIGLATGCKPKEPPPPPPTPPPAPLADTSRPSLPPPTSGELPPGHPPINMPAPSPVAQKGNGGLPPGHPPIKSPAAGEVDSGKPFEAKTQFAGISLIPSKDWQAVDPSAGRSRSGISGPVAVFVLPKVEGDAENATVRLTHFPGMRSIPLQDNLDRWYGQVKQPDGKATKDVAKLDTFEANGVTVTLVDMPGTLGDKQNYRMLAVVIEHPQGPHFLKVTGPDATVAKWKDSVIAYLKSAKIK